MHRTLLLLAGWLFLTPLALSGEYFPPRGEWQTIDAETAGFNEERFLAAVEMARAAAVTEPRDLHAVLLSSYTDREPDYRVLGPTRNREAGAGMIIRKGMIAAQWGDLDRVDMTFSVVKSYLSTVTALAWQDGLLPNLLDPVHSLVPEPGLFDSDHNARVTWHHLLNQTSDWSGTLWEIHDWADRPEGNDRSAWPHRELREPGSAFKYNDVRVNLLAYSLMQVWRQPLPLVLRERIMDPIGASPTWRWHGYRNSWVTLDGQRMQSVSGGGHFGGGLFINTTDHARFGLLFLRNGRWNGTQLVSEEWIGKARQPTPARPDYGYLWWLNTDRQRIPSAPESAFWAAGFGGNYIYIDQQNDLLIVLRWTPKLEAVVEAVTAALES